MCLGELGEFIKTLAAGHDAGRGNNAALHRVDRGEIHRMAHAGVVRMNNHES